MSAVPVRTRAIRGDRIRNHTRLLDAALEVFDADGIDAPLQRVAAAAGVSQASLFRHFADRNALHLDVYARHTDALAALSLENLTATKGQAAVTRIDSLFRTIVPQMLAHPSYAQLAGRVRRERAELDSDPQLLTALGALISEGQEQGVLADDITAIDLIVLQLMFSSLASYEQASVGWVWRRMLGLTTRGLTPEAALVSQLPPTSPL